MGPNKTIFVMTHLGHTFVYKDVTKHTCINGDLEITYTGVSTGTQNTAKFSRLNYAGYVVKEN